MLQIATIHIYTCSTLKFFDNIFIEDAMPEKALKKILSYLKIISTRVCKMIFLIKEKKI